MTITISAKPLEVKAELPGYGIFYLRRLGAAKDAEIQTRINEAKKLGENIPIKYKSLFDAEEKYSAEKNKDKLTELRASEEYKKARAEQTAADNALQDVKSYVDKCHLELWRSDDPKAMEKLLADFSLKEIQGFYAQVMAQAEAANA